MKDLKGATAYACVDRMGHKAESRVAECAMDSDSGALVGLINFDATGFRLGFAGLQGELEPWARYLLPGERNGRKVWRFVTRDAYVKERPRARMRWGTVYVLVCGLEQCGGAVVCPMR